MTRPPSSDDDSAPAVARDLTVRVEFVVVDGPAAAVWRARQTAAIRALLAWVADQQAEDSTEDGTPDSARDAGQGRASRRRRAA